LIETAVADTAFLVGVFAVLFKKALIMKKVFWPVIKCDERPARPDGSCFYCEVPFGGEHDVECVIRRQTVVLRVTDKNGSACEVISEHPEQWSLNHLADYMRGSGIQYIWSALEHHDLGSWGASIKVLRFATQQDEDELVNICNEKSLQH
jgi:hypothetical protein